MKNTRAMVIWAAVILLCLSFAVAADDAGKAVNAFESTAKIFYNGKEAALTAKPVLVEGENYLSLRELAGLFGMSIEWNEKEQAVTISDTAGSRLESMKAELSAKDEIIKGLEEKAKKLEAELKSSKQLNNAELQNLINKEYGVFEGVTCNTYISGNSDEIRTKTDVDLKKDKAAWESLNTDKKKLLFKGISDIISREYKNVKIKGYVKDISGARKLAEYSNTHDGEIKLGTYKNYDPISIAEEMLNEDYDYYLNGIHMTYTLDGNDNSIRYSVYTKLDKYSERWNKLTDGALKNFMKMLSNKINGELRRKCHVEGAIYDSDSGKPLAFCEQKVEGDFYFSREQ